MASSSQHQHQHHHHDGTLRYKVGIAIMLFLQAMSMIWMSSRLLMFGDCNKTVAQEEAPFSLPQSPDCSHNNSSNKSSSSSIIIQDAASLDFYNNNDNNDNDNNEPCSILMNKFHQINAGFRQQQGGNNNNNNNSYSYANADPQPYFNYAYYINQGFGRVVDHSTLHCVLALHLGRPCVLDLSTRDEFFTWRSFIHKGSYNWEMQDDNSRMLEDYYRAEIDMAVSEMKEIGDGKWENGVKNTYNKLFLLNEAPTTWPTKGKLALPDFYKNIESWRPNVQPKKAILSPNWGLWFPRLAMPAKAQGCKLLELMTRMQNALWQPTPLTLHLHKLRVDNYLSDNNNTTNKQNHPKATTTAVSEPYGAIHIRTFFLKDRLQRVQPTLEKCLDRIVTKTKLKDIKKWWILADRHTVAIQLSENITRFDFRHGYSDESFVANNEHSRNAGGQLAHKVMAPSVLDWTVLHESTVALITSGSYGISGARGRGKQRRLTCDDYFEVYY